MDPINIPPMIAYKPYMDPMGIDVSIGHNIIYGIMILMIYVNLCLCGCVIF